MNAPAQQKKLSELIESLMLSIDSGEHIDRFTLKKYEGIASKMSVFSERFLFLGFVYGAAGNHEEAIVNFKKGASFKVASIARNYLAFLSKTSHYDLYREESIRLANEIPDFRLYIRARNSSYADGNIQQTEYFLNKAIAMVRDDDKRAALLEEFEMHRHSLENFKKISGLSDGEIAQFTRFVVNVTKKFNVTAISHDYYTSQDGADAAVICHVLCLDPEVLSEMDIELATGIAMNESFCAKNATAWFRGVSKDQVGELL